MLALELIDSGLVLARQSGQAVELLAESPGVAILEERTTITGEDAARRVRRSPLLAQSNFWRGLSTEPLTRPSQAAQTSADIAFAHADALLRKWRDAESRILVALPGGYSREQLGLLLGVINETGVSVAGLVDAALAACSMDSGPARVLHLDLELHQAILTVLEYVGGDRAGLKRSRYEIALQHGLVAIQQSWIEFIADTFIRKTRFDPLHDANNEQQLVDQLPQWLAQLAASDRINISMSLADRTPEIELKRDELIAAGQQHYSELVRLVQSARVAGLPIELRVSHRVASLPGLLDRLGSLRDCTIKVLPKGAAALGALHHESAIARSADSLALVYFLPSAALSETPDQVAKFEPTPPALRPTHVLYQGRAWKISDQPLTLGWTSAPGKRQLLLPGSLPGISRAHCTLVRQNGAVLVEDHSTYGSFVNDERVHGRTTLAVGDRLRVGTPGITLDLIQMVDDHGAPQD
ncbi:MAG TPA: FHA domain-containing protein [Steroidobacteraceae bacterium]|nr:FHA domain-containing protein [Steroidobacteraceae bacterium]